MRDPYGAGKSKVTLKRPRATASTPAPTRAFASPRVTLAPTPAAKPPKITVGQVMKMSPQEKLAKFGFQRASEIDNAVAQDRAAMQPRQPKLEAAQPTASSRIRTGGIFKEGGQLASAALFRGFRVNDSFEPFFRGQKPVGSFRVTTENGVVTKRVYRAPDMSRPSQDDVEWAALQKAIGPDIIRKAANPRVAALQAVLGGLTGIPATTDALRKQNFLGAGAQLAIFFPFGRFLRGSEEAGRAVKAAVDVTREAGGGRDEIVKAATKAMKQRIFRVNNLDVAIPAAGSRTGAGAENLVDTVRGITSKAGLKTEAERAGSEYEITQRNRMKTLTNAAQTLRKIGKILNDAQQYTLRILGEGVNPLDRIAMHEQLIADARASGSMDEAAYHGVHSSLIQQATKKYIDVGADGAPVLKPSAPERLREAWALLQEVASQREELYRGLGLLHDKQIMERIQAPGRVTQGARYIPAMDEIAQRLEASPGRKLLQQAVASYHPEDQPAQDEIMRMADAMALVKAEQDGDPMAVENLYDQLHDVVYHDRLQGNEGGMLFQGDPMLQAGIVQARMMMEKGTSADEAISKTAAMFGLNENELRQSFGATGDSEMSRILSNRDPEAELSAGVKATLGDEGGHTWTANLLTDEGKDGFAVSIEGAELPVKAERFNESVVREYRQAVQGRLDADPGLRIGAWRDGDTVYLDLTKIVPTREEALREGADNGQQAIWDRANGEAIEVPKGDELATLRRQGDRILYQGVEDFGDAARNEIESHRAFARDIKRTLPEKDWPSWVKNTDRPPMRPVDMSPVEPKPIKVNPLPNETPEELASRQAAVDQDYMIRRREWEDQVARRKAQEDQLDARDAALREEMSVSPGDTFPEDWLPQRAYSDPYGAGIDMPGAYKGAIQFTPQGAILHLTERTDTTTFVHEMSHFARRYIVNEEMPGYGTLAKEVGLKVTNEAERAAARRARQPVPRIIWSEWDTAAEEKFARMFESWMRTGRAPQSFSRTASVLSRRLRDVYEHSDLPDVKPEVASFFEKLVSPKERRGGRLVGAEDFNAGVAYIPYVRGIPQSRSALTDSTAAYFRRAQSALFGGSDRAAIGAGPQDKTLKKAFKGNLLLHGNFKINVTDASAESLMVAARLSAARQARADLLKAASDVPSLPSDIAIKVDPTKDSPAELSAFFDKLHDLDAEGKLDSKALEGIDLKLSDALREAFMPSTIDGVPLEKAADEAIASKQPIDNIKWIPRDFIDKTMLRGTRASNAAWTDGLNKVAKVAVQGSGITFDAMNDIAKAVLLYMNPAYAPVNLAGNLVMNMMQQGPFMPINLWKSVFLHRDLNVRERVFLDSMMGHGVVTSLITQGKVHPASIAHNTIGRLLNLAVDLIPRRSAFLHEARKLGFDTTAKLKLLLDDRDHSEEMLRIRDYISRRANDAIVDYDRMSPLDKAVINRVIFFYPWIKGATRYTNRFIVEHPYQAMAIAVMADHAYNAANEQIGDRPAFLKETFPISTRALGVGVPFTGIDFGADSVLGDYAWTDSEGRPMTINVRQAFTMTTPLDMATSFASFAMGDLAGAGDLVQMLTPVPYAAGVALYGKDPFKRRDVPQGFGTFLNQLFGAPPIKLDIQRITMSEKARRERNQTALYPRSKGNEEAHMIGGGLTPTPVNTVTAAGLAAKTSGDTYKQQVLKLTQAAKASGIDPPPPEVLDDLKWRNKLTKAEKRNSPYSEKLQAAAKVYAERTGDKSVVGDVAGVTNEQQARDYYYRLRDIMFANYNRYYSYLSRAKQANGG